MKFYSPLFFRFLLKRGGAFLCFLALLTGPAACRSGPQVIPVEPPPELPPPPELTPPPPEPPSLEAILMAVAGRLEAGDGEGALALFDTIPLEETGSPEIRLLKASVYTSLGNLGEARAVAGAVLEEFPDHGGALFVLSAIEGALGKEREQRVLLNRVLALEGNHVEALVSLGNLELQSQSLRKAAAFFDQALAVEPENLEALLGRAGVYRYNRDPRQAELLLNQAIELYPRSARARGERARIYREASYPKQALADLDIAKSLAPRSYWIAVDRGNALLDLNRKTEALGEFERARELDPGNFMAYVFTSGLKDELRDYEGAERDYATLARLKPDYYFAFEGLGMHKMKQGLWIEARDAFIEAYRRSSGERTYALLAAMNWMREGPLNGPKTFLNQVLREVPRDTLEWYVFRLYHDLTGDNDVALRVDREKDLDTKARMLFYLASYYDIRGNRTLADKYFVQVRDLDRRSFPEWRLNQWALEARNLAAF